MDTASEISNKIKKDLLKGLSDSFEIGSSVRDYASVFHFATPSASLNVMLGGGLPAGTMIQFGGASTAGKSSLAYSMSGLTYKVENKLLTIVVDAEGALDVFRACDASGLPKENLIRQKPSTLEDAFESLTTLLIKIRDNKDYDDYKILVIWDSIASGYTRKQMESNTLNAGGMGEKPRLLGVYMPALIGILNDFSTRMTIIIINQIYESMDAYGSPINMKMGNSLKHSVDATFLIAPRRGEITEENSISTSTINRLSTIKSRLCPPVKNVPLYIDFTNSGLLDKTATISKELVDFGYIRHRSAGWYFIDAEKITKDLEETGLSEDVVDRILFLANQEKSLRILDWVKFFEKVSEDLQYEMWMVAHLLILARYSKFKQVVANFENPENTFKSKILQAFDYFFPEYSKTKSISTKKKEEK